MAFIRTTRRAVLTEEEQKALRQAVEIFRNLDREDHDGEYFCEVENQSVGCEWGHIKSIIEELLDDCDIV